MSSGRRLIAFGLVAAVGAAVLASAASGALFFLFKPTSAKPGDVVGVRLGGTPASFTAAQRVKPYRKPIRLYLVPNRVAADVRSRFDRRLSFVAQVVPDRNGHGIATFRVPPLDTDDYATAAWCPGCAPYSRGQTFFTLHVGDDVVPRYRPLMVLHVELPSAADSCPVTKPFGGKPRLATMRAPNWYGNGLLGTWLSLDGVLSVSSDNQGWEGDPPGSIGTKLYWFSVQGSSLTLTGERLDAPSSPLVVHHVNRGQSTFWRGPTWATPVTFPTPGCWRLTARVDDVALTIVMKVSRT